ncbi:MAG: Smr/MutS family protein [Eubacteriales bacterium]|nr:Smr/MutS family protein [Eubacteriales bacterium]
MAKVKEVNLEYGRPLADDAVRNMVNQLGTCKRQGYKAVILVHGYGSSGTGGAIKVSVRSKLRERSLSGIVRSYCGGEHWLNKKKELLEMCSSLSDYERRIDGNSGVTVVILK